MALNDVKEITIPEGVVKKIEDGNGNIIWGSQTYFPYRLLQYIQSDGTGQYIDTGYKCLVNDTIELKISYDSTSTEQENGMSSAGTTRAFVGVQDNVGTYGRGSRAAKSNLLVSANTAVVQKIVTNSSSSFKYYINNSSNSVTGITINNSNLSFTICARKIKVSPGYDKPFLGGKVYYCKLGSGRNMWPVQRKSDNAIGMYDIITNTFYANNGSGSFTAGPLVDEYWDLTDPS